MNRPNYHYQFEKKGSQHTCPQCHRKKHYTRFVDQKTEELLPEKYGVCNNTDKCGYHQSPYKPDEKGNVYANTVRQLEQEDWLRQRELQRFVKGVPQRTSKRVQVESPRQAAQSQYVLPEGLFRKSLSHYQSNTFAHLLRNHFGVGVANELINQFKIGTSAYWPGATVFWLIDEMGRVRGGQVVLFDDKGSTMKLRDSEGKVTFRHTLPVGYVLNKTVERSGEPKPDWLISYTENAPKVPICFGLHQLQSAPKDQPVALVEAPATAVFCTAYFPSFIWLAVGSLSFITEERLADLKNRKIRLFPDLSEVGNAYKQWDSKAKELRSQGFCIEADSFLEHKANGQQRKDKYDLRDYLMEQWKGYPPSWDTTM